MQHLDKLIAFTIFLGAILFPIAAFAASNSRPGITGEGVVPIRGCVIPNVNHQLSDPARAKEVMVKLKSSSTQFTTCTPADSVGSAMSLPAFNPQAWTNFA